MYLLDTNVLNELRKVRKGNADQRVIDWVASVDEDQIYTNAIVLMEIERGVLAMERKDELQGRKLRFWFENDVKQRMQGKILTIDERTAQLCAKLHIPDHSPENDAWIAASAIQHNLILVTRNVSDFARSGVRLLNPFG